jgi:uncharacterized protein YdaU (DUF1376 family)
MDKNMHYYQFNIGDYLSHTRHLTPIEDICYRRSLDYYYLHEKPLIDDIDKLSRLLILFDYQEELYQVINEFFVKTEKGYINPRADKEIQQYQSFSEAGKRGAAKRWSKGADSPPIDTPLANNKHKTLNTKHKTTNTYSEDFTIFWNAYPSKVGKDKAYSSWNKYKPRLDDVMYALSWQQDSDQWKRGYIPNSATYLNQGRWKDEEPIEGVPF